MVSGFDRYFQIVKCFRDEDLRADRQPEFTQIDVEMSFVTEEDIFAMVEGMMTEIGKAVGVKVETPFDRMTYKDAMLTYGSDKPDVRFEMKLVDVKEYVCGAGFKVFDSVKENGGEIRAIVAEKCASYSRKQIKDLEDIAKSYGAKGLAYFKWTDEGFNSPIMKFLGEEKVKNLFDKLSAKQGDLILIVADSFSITCNALGAVRNHLGKVLNLILKNTFKFVWVTDFPMFEWDEDEKRYVAVHHPFTAPNLEYADNLMKNADKATARAYDIALNGFEIGGGSIRIHQNEMQQKVFEAIGMSLEEAKDKFGFLLDAFKHGAPPHGGIAFGLDRIAMIFAGEDSLREVIAFPKTTSATCLLTNSPSKISEAQKKELGL
jgi:aspartyl-tRNA synthetase